MNKLSAISRLGRAKIVLSALAMASCLLANARAENPAIYSVNAKESKLEIRVHRQGFLKAFGHDHLISAKQLSGQVRLVQSNLTESSVDLVVETRSLSVLDPAESEKDRREVQSTMLGEKVLDATQYPQIQFTSSSVRSVGQNEGATEIQVEGTLRLHGVEKPVVLPMRVHVEQGDLSADGEFSLLQSDYGIVPVKAGGGAVRVKDELRITFHIVAGAASSDITSRQFSHASNGV